jgi:hypothetical protein
LFDLSFIKFRIQAPPRADAREAGAYKLRPKGIFTVYGDGCRTVMIKCIMTRGLTRDNHSAAETTRTTAADRPAGLVCTITRFCPVRILVFLAVIVLFALTAVLNARGADARSGQRLAQDHCAACHSIVLDARSEVAAAPPFEVIGRKYGFDADRITHAIAGPHPKMNFSPRPREAAEIAAYIATLRR